MFSGKLLDYQDELLVNNGFWLDLNLKDFQVQWLLLLDIDVDIISQVLFVVVVEVNVELENVEVSWKVKGYMLVVDVLGVKMGGFNSLCVQYMKVVFVRVKVDLLGEFVIIGWCDIYLGQESQEIWVGLLVEVFVVICCMKGFKWVMVKKV